MKRVGRGMVVGVYAVSLLLVSHVALADELYKTLLADGYEVKNVVVLNPDFTSRYGNKNDFQDTVIVSMQKGSSSAACYWYATDWITQNLGEKKCAVFSGDLKK
jgi:hypothetical protein